MSNLRPFQIVLLGVFFFLALASLVLLSVYNPLSNDEPNPYGTSVVLWGTFDDGRMEQILRTISEENEDFSVVSYERIDSRTFDTELVNAIAEGRTPDLIILPHEKLVKQRSKLSSVSYETITKREIRDTYVDGADIFALSDGLYAIPFAVDPMVLYWNRDLFSSGGLAQAPATWETFVGRTVGALTTTDNNRNLLQSAVAFGEYGNVTHAKETLLMLAQQSGSGMITEGAGGYTVLLNQTTQENARPPLESSLQFYTDFSNSNNALYTWNSAQPKDLDAFLGGDLGMYFGFGSEAGGISRRNPNLNFDMALVPQGQVATIKRTYGTFYGFAIPRATANAQGAFAVARTLGSREYAKLITDAYGFAPVHRATIDAGSTNPFLQVMYNSALIARGWLDPDEEATGGIIQTMVEDVVSNRVRIKEAVTNAVIKITQQF